MSRKMSMPTSEDLVWADGLVDQLIRLSDDRTKTVRSMLDFNAARYTLVYTLAKGRIPF